ncbi:MAG: hypothetical protein M3Y33_00630 [Actinomycetota bacterium]|nr:hypothetical protein [Actinomycetota bacterium]
MGDLGDGADVAGGAAGRTGLDEEPLADDPRSDERAAGDDVNSAVGCAEQPRGSGDTQQLRWSSERIAATIPERDNQIAHRRKKPGRPIDFGNEQKVRYRGRNVAGRCFNKLKQWRGIAMRSDKSARNCHAGLCLGAILHWLTSSFSNTA